MSEKLTRNYEMDLCSGPILKKMLAYSLPLMFSGILQLLFNAADIVVIGKFAGDNSMAAVGSNASLIGLITNLFIGLSIGANVLTARYFGAKDFLRLERAVHTAMLLSVCCGIFLTLIGLIGAEQFLIWMDTPPEVLSLAVQYLRIYFVGMVATMVYNFGSAILRSVGDTKRPLRFLAIAGVINVLLNLLFVIVFKMDVAGVALATVISQCISALLVVLCLLNEEGAIRLCVSKLHIDWKELLMILKIGLPAGLQGTVFALSNVVIQSSINSFGEVVMAGNAAAINIENFVYLAMNAFYQATVSFVSQNLGAGNYKRINRAVLTGEFCVIAVGLLMGNAAVLFGRELLGLYSSSADVINIGLNRLQVISGTYAICGMMDVMVGALRGMGYSVMPMIVSLIGACGLRLVWIATVFQIPAYHTPTVIYLSYPISWLLTLIVHLICFFVVRRKVKAKLEACGEPVYS